MIKCKLTKISHGLLVLTTFCWRGTYLRVSPLIEGIFKLKVEIYHHQQKSELNAELCGTGK